MERIENQKQGFIKPFIRILGMGIKADPVQFAGFAVLDACNGIISATFALFTQRFFDTAAASTGYSREVVFSLLTLCAVLVIQHVINGTCHTLIPNLKHKMDRNAVIALNKKASSLPPVLFEDQKFLDHLNKAYQGTEYSFSTLVPVLRFFFLYAPYAVFMGGYLYSLDPLLAAGIAFIFVPTIISYLLRPGILFQLEDDSAPIRRESEHYRDCLVHPVYYKETRTLGAYRFFSRKYVDAIWRLNQKIWKAQMKVKAMSILSSIITLLGYGGVLFLLVNSLLKGNITTGMFAAVFSSLAYIFMMADESLEMLLAPTSGMATVRNFISVLNLPKPQQKSAKIHLEKGITFENVSFKYHGSKRNALSNISLTIRQGETVAIVGTNGSGKTTFARLLLGLYQPDSGTVKVGGQDTKEVNPDCIYQEASAVFQRFQKYKMTLSENIMISSSQQAADIERINECAQKSDIDMDSVSFPEGLDSMLSRDFDGVDLSGGQWQRIAIARGLYKVNDIILMDEPTAAIDPMEETKIYEKFAVMAQDKTAVLITHRIGSARIADRIIVLSDGEFVEEGTHEELMNHQGVYKKMFEAQMKWYQ